MFSFETGVDVFGAAVVGVGIVIVGTVGLGGAAAELDSRDVEADNGVDLLELNLRRAAAAAASLGVVEGGVGVIEGGASGVVEVGVGES